MKNTIIVIFIFLLAFQLLDLGINATIGKTQQDVILALEEQGKFKTNFFIPNQAGQLCNGFWCANANQTYHLAMYTILLCFLSMTLTNYRLWEKNKFLTETKPLIKTISKRWKK